MKITAVKINGIENPMGYELKDPRISWKVRETRAKRQTGVCIEVAGDPLFENMIYTKEGKDLSSLGERLELELKPCKRYYVRVQVENELGEKAVSDPAYFETAKMDQPWTGQWITTREEDRFHPIFSKRFRTDGKIKEARLYLSGLGLFRAKLNGSFISEEVLTPYYSNYHEEIQYLTFDITDQIREENTLEVFLGNGWYKGRFGLAGMKENFGSRFRLIGEIRLTMKDGRTETIPTDESWSYAGSDIEASDIYDGEVLNRLLWKEKKNEKKPAVLTEAEGKLIERYSLPLLEMEERKVKEILHTPAGETVLDFGQNFAGYPVFHAALPRGTKIVLDFGEILQDENFYNENYRSAKSRFTYISDGREEWVKPSFTYFGFRYVRVTGWPGELKKEDFVGKAVYSGMDVTGKIETGHAGVNQLFSNILWGQKSNFVDFPTDCPQRDERLGWTGDAQVFCGTASYNMDTAAFYHKFLHDLRTEQKQLDGVVPGVIPVFDKDGAIFSSVWGDVATFLPTVLYEHYGDILALKESYPMMKDWVDKITREDKARGQRYLFDYGNQLGDWLALDGRTQQSMKGGTDDYYIGSCYYAASVKKTADAAEVLGLTEDEANYRDLYEKIYAAILKEYFSESGRLCIDTQTAYIVSLYLGIYKDKERIVEGLCSRLYKDCYKLKGGFVGAPLMCRVMAENGMEEEAFYYLLQEGYPGWMHCINLGATTIWERWNSVLDDGHLSGTMMNSLNHYSFGAIGEYLYRDVAGLKALEPGFRKALITPLMNQKLKFMKMTYDSAMGTYRVAWRIKSNGRVKVEVEVPFGCTAVIGLPFYEGDVSTVDAGSYEFEYVPTRDLRCRYTRKTLFKDMMQDEKAMEIIDRVSPFLSQFLGSGDEEFLNESLETLNDLSFLGFSPEEIEKLTGELTQIKETL
ncbi:alpha-L-rhamnosidase [Mediterraneibacter massiliensis]|uniref:alpha-L-rhamnosidase n=1 Tax=Mediterraneibacter massiliensis TaxID=1720300 RepID=UPI0024ACF199|nr:alpha-L-rhamnosidase [Mediterraneibacter massiliensis]